MAKINILPSKVYNRIAAGEVVDRPASVVKELVENSIDAGATEIEIHIEQGGKQLIRIVDNGCGIEREDLQSAFLPHATSKIAVAEDLENILTLGFRGEAIASISSVSKMRITSKTETGKCYSLSCDGGEIGQIVEASAPKGTEVEVEALFFHTPVRLGFLKSDKAEETEITTLVSRFILNRSDISFAYYANGKKILQSFGGGDEEAMACVYGAATLAECFCVQAEKHGIRIRGYIGNQNFFKANKSYQSVFLNGRHIVNTTVSAAISNAYASYMMKRQYPFYVLHIDVPTEIVDVNVHPNKADVRFADNQIVYGCIYTVISAILDGQTKAMDYIVKTPSKGIFAEPEQETKPQELPFDVKPSEKEGVKIPTAEELNMSYEEAKKEIEESAPAFVAKQRGEELSLQEKRGQKLDEDIKAMKDRLAALDESLEKSREGNPRGYVRFGQMSPPRYNEKEETFGEVEVKRGLDSPYVLRALENGAEKLHKRFPDLHFERTVLEVNQEEKVLPANSPTQTDYLFGDGSFEDNKRYLEEMEQKAKQNRIEVSNCKYAGKLFNTYLLYEQGDDAYIIDQHAAHERLIFDRLKAQMDARVVVRQPLLIPYEIALSAFEGDFIRDHASLLNDIGFGIQESQEEANVFQVREIPQDLIEIDLTSFIHDLLGHVGSYRAIKLEDLLRDKLATAACKAAVKGGMDLTQKEVEELFKMMDGDMGLKCPHGRPVVVKMTKKQLEKMFKRIV